MELFNSVESGCLPGEVLGDKYRIERVLGRGGMGIVLLARNQRLGERVAIKVLARDPTPALAARLLMEARAAARLRSDHVVRVFDVGNTESGAPYLVMEYLEGETLCELLRRGEPPSLAQVVRWLIEVCDGLATAHRHGIVHRDLKPANLFLEQRQDGSVRAKILDFGIAKLPEPEALATTTHAIGSPLYMAPEQLANRKDTDARADLWALGVVAYEALTGRVPFATRSLLELARQVQDATHLPACGLRADLPQALSRVIDRCLAKRPDDRWPSAVELMAALRPFASAQPARAGARASEASLDTRELELGETLEATDDSSPGLERRDTAGGGWGRTMEWGLSLLLASVLGYSGWARLQPAAGAHLAPALEPNLPLVPRVPEPGPQPAGVPAPDSEPAAPAARAAQPTPAAPSKSKVRRSARPPSSAAFTRSARPSSAHSSGSAAASSAPSTPAAAPLAEDAASTAHAVGPLPIDRQISW